MLQIEVPPRIDTHLIRRTEKQWKIVAQPAVMQGGGGLYSSHHNDDGDELPDTVRVMCNGVPGIFLLPDSSVICGCQECCAQLPVELLHQPRLLVNSCRSISPTEFERHAGMGATRKWRHSIKVLVDLPPNTPLPVVPASATDGSRGTPISIGRWLDEHPPLPRQPPPPSIPSKTTTSRADRSSRPSYSQHEGRGAAGPSSSSQPAMQPPSRKRSASQAGGAAAAALPPQPRPVPQIHIAPPPLQVSHSAHYLGTTMLGSHDVGRRAVEHHHHHTQRGNMPVGSSMHQTGMNKLELSPYNQPNVWDQRSLPHSSAQPSYHLGYYQDRDTDMLHTQMPGQHHQFDAPQAPNRFDALQQWQQPQPLNRYTPDPHMQLDGGGSRGASMQGRASPALRNQQPSYMPSTARLATAAAAAAAAAAEAAASRRLAYQHTTTSPQGNRAGPEMGVLEPNPLLMMLAATAATQQVSRSADSSPVRSDQEGQEPSNVGPAAREQGDQEEGGEDPAHTRPSAGAKHEDTGGLPGNKLGSSSHRPLALQSTSQPPAAPAADRNPLRVLSFSVRPVQAPDSLAANPMLALRISMDGMVFCGTLSCEAEVTNVEAVRTLLMLQPQQTPPPHMVCALCMRGPPPSRPGTNLGPLIPVHVTVKAPASNPGGAAATIATAGAAAGAQGPAATAEGAQPSNPAEQPAAQDAQAAPQLEAPPNGTAVKQEHADPAAAVPGTVELSSQTLQDHPGAEAAGHQVNQGAVEQQVKPGAAAEGPNVQVKQAVDEAGAASVQEKQELKPAGADLNDAAKPASSGPTHCMWLHLQCACWCPEARVLGGKVVGLVAALKRAHRTRCCSCGRLGASLVCSSHGCGATYHLPCAQLVNCSFQEQGPHARMLCPSHRHPTKDTAPGERNPSAPAHDALALAPTSPGAISQGFSLGIADDLDPSMASLLHPRGEALLPTTPDLLNIIDDDPMMDLLTAEPGELGNPPLGQQQQPQHDQPLGSGGDVHRSMKRPRVGAGGGAGGYDELGWRGGSLGAAHRTAAHWVPADQQQRPADYASDASSWGTDSEDDADNQEHAYSLQAGRPYAKLGNDALPAGFGAPRQTEQQPGMAGAWGRQLVGGFGHEGTVGRGHHGLPRRPASDGSNPFRGDPQEGSVASGDFPGAAGSRRDDDWFSNLSKPGPSQQLPRSRDAPRRPGGPGIPGRTQPQNAYIPSHRMSQVADTDQTMFARAMRDEFDADASLLGGTTGQTERAGRCAVCVIQRKGKCGTASAPRKCLRRQLQASQGDGGQGSGGMPGSSTMMLDDMDNGSAHGGAAAAEILMSRQNRQQQQQQQDTWGTGDTSSDPPPPMMRGNQPPE